jgi:glyoxylase-like metal-dependent hydrolase (beta-lactamase superfamily II)
VATDEEFGAARVRGGGVWVKGETAQIGPLSVAAVPDEGPRGDFGNYISVVETFTDVPDASWRPFRERFPAFFPVPDHWIDGRRSWLVRGPAATVLVDAGLGPGLGRLLDSLAALDVAPDAIDRVFLTHLDHDHVGWALDAGGAPVFPNARYAVTRTEWEHALRPSSRGRYERWGPYLDDGVLPLAGLGLLDLIDDGDLLTEGVRVFAAPGHTPGHAAVLVEGGSARLLLAADAFHHPAQVTEPGWSTIYDADPPRAAATRAGLAGLAAGENMRVSATHFPGPAFGRIVGGDGRMWWRPD